MISVNFRPVPSGDRVARRSEMPTSIDAPGASRPPGPRPGPQDVRFQGSIPVGRRSRHQYQPTGANLHTSRAAETPYPAIPSRNPPVAGV